MVTCKIRISREYETPHPNHYHSFQPLATILDTLIDNHPCLDLSATGDTAPKELVHVTKNRPRPARGRRPPTRASGGGGQQNSVVGPEVVVDNFDDGIDSFFSKPHVRPHSAAYVLFFVACC